MYPNGSHGFKFLRGVLTKWHKRPNEKIALHFKKHFISLKSNSKDATEKTSLQNTYGYVSRYANTAIVFV